MFRKLLSVALAIAWATGSQMNPAARFNDIPPVEDGETLYASGFDVDVTGTLTNPTGGNITPGTAAQILLLSRLNVLPVGAPKPLVNQVKAVNLARLWRAENRGFRPGQWASTGLIASGGGTAAISYSLPVRFGPSSALRPEDFYVPLTAFGDSAITVQFGTGDDVSTGLTFSGTVTVTPLVYAMPVVECPTFTTIDEQEVAAGTTTPSIDTQSGRLVSYLSARRGGVFATTEQTGAKLNIGSQIVSDNNTTAKVFYRAFNEGGVFTAMQDHTAAAAAIDDSFPLVVPDAKDGSNKISRGIKLDGRKPVLTVNTATNNYDLIRRFIPGADQQMAWARIVATSQNLPADFYESQNAATVTNSHKPTGNPELIALLPAKATA